MRDAAVLNPMIEHALEQRREVVERLCREILDELARRHEKQQASEYVRLSYYSQPLAPNRIIRDIVGEAIEEGSFRDALRVLLLIDPWPHANWAHECWVATLKLAANVRSDDAWKTERRFPPQEIDQAQLVPYAACGRDGLTLFSPPEERVKK